MQLGILSGVPFHGLLKSYSLWIFEEDKSRTRSANLLEYQSSFKLLFRKLVTILGVWISKFVPQLQPCFEKFGSIPGFRMIPVYLLLVKFFHVL